MKIFYDDEATQGRISVDEESLATFLVERGMEKKQLKALTIRFRYMAERDHPDGERRHLLGACLSPTLVYVYTHNEVDQEYLSEDRLNTTLLHELRHCMQPDRAAYMEIAYSTRPTEADARAFAKQYKAYRFVTYTPKYSPVPKPTVVLTVVLSLCLVMKILHRF